MKKIILHFAWVVFAIFFIWMTLRKVDFQELAQAVRYSKISYIVAAIGFFFVGYSCRIERWRLMMTQENALLRWSTCVGPLMAGVAANNVLPFRAGDVLRAFGFNKRLGISASTSVTSLFVERVLDLLMVVLFLGVALTYFGIGSKSLIGFGGAAMIMVGATLLFTLAFPNTFKRPAFLFAGVVSIIHPKFGAKLSDECVKIFNAFDHTSNKSIIIKLVAWSFAAWTAEGFVFWLVALSIPSILNNLAAWVALPIGTFATVMPSTPGYIGTFDYFTSKSMIIMGNSSESSIIFALMVHSVLWFPPTLIGGLYLLIKPRVR